tara:strand:+ start:408 stop:941 length:534 start_codon:yes stop_codon:yes gene_type:complete
MLESIQEILDRFKEDIIKEAKKGVPKDSKRLANSIKGYVKESKNSIQISFTMDLYGAFQDQGVRGAGGVRATTSKFNRRNNKGKMWKQNAPNSEFSFKKGTKPSVKHFEKWSKKRGLSPFAVRESVWRQGIKPTLFFTKPFEKYFNQLPPELLEKYGLEMQTLIGQTFTENFKRFNK